VKNYFKSHKDQAVDTSMGELENFLQMLHTSKPMSVLCKKEYKTINDYNKRHQNDVQIANPIPPQNTKTHDFEL